MVLTGQIKNGVVILDQKIDLPEGTTVRVEPIEPQTLAERFRSVIGRAPDLPTELAEKHDH